MAGANRGDQADNTAQQQYPAEDQGSCERGEGWNDNRKGAEDEERHSFRQEENPMVADRFPEDRAQLLNVIGWIGSHELLLSLVRLEREASLPVPSSTHAHRLHLEERRDFFNLIGDVADSNRAVMRRAVPIPGIHEFSGIER